MLKNLPALKAVIEIAQRERRALGDPWLDTGHLLLGLVQGCHADLELRPFGVTPRRVRRILRGRAAPPSEEFDRLSGDSSKPHTALMARADRAAREHGFTCIDTTLICALLLESRDSRACAVLRTLRVDLDVAHAELMGMCRGRVQDAPIIQRHACRAMRLRNLFAPLLGRQSAGFEVIRHPPEHPHRVLHAIFERAVLADDSEFRIDAANLAHWLTPEVRHLPGLNPAELLAQLQAQMTDDPDEHRHFGVVFTSEPTRNRTGVMKAARTATGIRLLVTDRREYYVEPAQADPHLALNDLHIRFQDACPRALRITAKTISGHLPERAVRHPAFSPTQTFDGVYALLTQPATRHNLTGPRRLPRRAGIYARHGDIIITNRLPLSVQIALWRGKWRASTAAASCG